MKSHKVFEIHTDGKHLYTQSLVPGKSPFDEKRVRDGNEEYREFEPTRSKLAAAIANGTTNTGIRKNSIVLYLGISHGYTASFISDMIGKDGLIFGIDPAPRVVRDLVFLSQDRNNIVPILADANHPEEYATRICLPDVLIQDVAQRNQAEIFLKNCKTLLKQGGYALLAVKARSIDARKKSKQIFEEVRNMVEKELTVIDFRSLEPFERDHCMIIIKNEPPKEVVHREIKDDREVKRENYYPRRDERRPERYESRSSFRPPRREERSDQQRGPREERSARFEKREQDTHNTAKSDFKKDSPSKPTTFSDSPHKEKQNSKEKPKEDRNKSFQRFKR